MEIKSKALEVNIADYHVEVEIDPKYEILLSVMSRYCGLMEGLTTFLKELSHPYINWQFVVREARGYCLDYFHLLKDHPDGPRASSLFVDIYLDALAASPDPLVQSDAVDNLLLYLQKIIREGGAALPSFLPVLNTCFKRIVALEPSRLDLFVRSYYPIGPILSPLASCTAEDFSDANRLMGEILRRTFVSWAGEEDPKTWFEKEAGQLPVSGLFDAVSRARFESEIRSLQDLFEHGDPRSAEVLARLLAFPNYHQVVACYRDIPDQLSALGKAAGEGKRWKLLFLFHIMAVPGLARIHEETLWEINRTLSCLIENGSLDQARELLEKTFGVLQERIAHFPTTALSCVLNVGKAVYKTDESDLIGAFIDAMLGLGFQPPLIEGVGDDWQIRVNIAHILNIRTWLELIELNPKWSPKLLSYLTIHLSLCGMFVKDTDLFPREITQLLNSPIDPVYNLAKQLARLFPVYFNDIGAEGKLRDISTELDEITHRKDLLIHFLRKQSHVESSNRIPAFITAVFEFWRTGKKEGLEPFVPPYLYQQIASSGEYVDGVRKGMGVLDARGVKIPEEFLAADGEGMEAMLRGKIPEADARRIVLAAEFYRLIYQKYHLDYSRIEQQVKSLRTETFPELQGLLDALSEESDRKKLTGLLGYLEKLKVLILSPESFEAFENIYKKRHVTVDIPSMYGSYTEAKFDALGLSFRLEGLVNVLFEAQVASFDLSLITKATFFRIFDLLQLFGKALAIDGISSREYERQLSFLSLSLELRDFSFTQYLDVFKGFAQAVKNIISDYFNNVHEENLNRILARIPLAHILPKYLPPEQETDREGVVSRIPEMFCREQIASSLGLQQMDLFLTRILKVLFHQADQLPEEKLQLLLSYDPQKAISGIGRENRFASGMIYLGAKAHHILELKKFGMPVPPGFIITTEVFRSREIVEGYPPAERNFRKQLSGHMALLEEESGKRLGDIANPLLVSVRSGAAISQPGMMDTFLDVGLNEAIVEGLAERSGNAWFAWDSYRRFLQGYGMSFGLVRDDFDTLMAEAKARYGAVYKHDLTSAQMKETALSYQTRIEEEGISLLEDPFDQIALVIKKIFDSWDSPKARAYRRIMGISDDWGTAVTIQAMVFGNISQQAGTGVAFTHNPRWSGETLKLWGDFTLGNQGEDVVSGLVKTLPISLMQQSVEKRETDITLETHYPEIYVALKAWASDLIYVRGWGPQEMEFTFEGPTARELYLLQVRDMGIRERKKVLTFLPEDVSPDRLAGRGIGVSGGAMSGRAIFSLEEIDQWRKKEPGTCLILLRGDTVPDDILEISAADGLLTARGGMTSHAAVVAHRIGKTCVVGCEHMACSEREKHARFRETLIRSGDFISIDGRSGSVYQGRLRISEG